MKPIERKTPISLVCSYRFADILAERAKKHKNITMIMIELKTLFIMPVTLFSVSGCPLEPVRSVYETVSLAAVMAFESSSLNY